jgi:hypothetical protein
VQVVDGTIEVELPSPNNQLTKEEKAA